MTSHNNNNNDNKKARKTMTQEQLQALRQQGGVKPKTFTDVYKGPATITAVDALPPRFTQGMTPEEIAGAFDIEFTVQPDAQDIKPMKVTMPISKRKFVTRNGEELTDTMMTVRTLEQQKLIAGGDVGSVFAKVGAKVGINAYNETSSKGTFLRCRFEVVRAKLDNAELMRRLALLTGHAPAAPNGYAAPAASQEDAPF